MEESCGGIFKLENNDKNQRTKLIRKTKLESNEETKEESYGETKLENNEETKEESYRETKLQINEETREESYGEKLESRDQSYGGIRLESNEKNQKTTKKLENKVTEERSQKATE